MTAFVQVVATWPYGSVSRIVLTADPDATRDSLIRDYRHTTLDRDRWDGDTLVRHRCACGGTGHDCRPVVERITFHDTDPRQEADQ